MISNDGFKVRQQRVILCNQIVWSRKLAIYNLGFLASSLVSFYISENCLLLCLAGNLWKLNSFDILYYVFQISHQNCECFFTPSNTFRNAFNVIFRKTHIREKACKIVVIFSKHICKNLFRLFVKPKPEVC